MSDFIIVVSANAFGEHVGFVYLHYVSDTEYNMRITPKDVPAPRSSEMASERDAEKLMKWAKDKFPHLAFEVDILDDDEDYGDY